MGGGQDEGGPGQNWRRRKPSASEKFKNVLHCLAGDWPTPLGIKFPLLSPLEAGLGNFEMR